LMELSLLVLDNALSDSWQKSPASASSTTSWLSWSSVISSLSRGLIVRAWSCGFCLLGQFS
jgi:hypothetical protein